MTDEEQVRERFAEFSAGADAELDLALGALLIAAEANPELDVEGCLARLDSLAGEARGAIEEADEDLDRVICLNRFLFEEQHFVGNQTDYYDPRNSFLDQVLERRLGIPITLAVVYIEVARRIGLSLAGIGFPGHFLVRAAESPPLFVDAFHARVLTRDDCEELLHETQGDDVELESEHLQVASTRQILARILANLKSIYYGAGKLEDALSCCDRILLLLPDAPTELRDRGLIYAQLDCFGAALADLERFVELVDDPRITGGLSETLDELRERALQIH